MVEIIIQLENLIKVEDLERENAQLKAQKDSEIAQLKAQKDSEIAQLKAELQKYTKTS